MFKNLRVSEKRRTVPEPAELTLTGLTATSDQPIALRSLNDLPDTLKQRIYRILIPPPLFSRFDLDPITGRGPDRQNHLHLDAEPGSAKVMISATSPIDNRDPFITIELSDNRFNSIDLNLLVISDPAAKRYDIDVDADGNPTMFGTVGRNLQAEQWSFVAGLAPAQIRKGLRGTRLAIEQIETFLVALGHKALYLEPLTYASAWVFERYGFAYTRGHKLMQDINTQFQPGGELHAALDGNTPFRGGDQWNTVRGRAWAIHDGVLDAIDARWDDLRMVKARRATRGSRDVPQRNLLGWRR